MTYSFTMLEKWSRTPPSTTKTIPMPKKRGNTVLAVRMGCHAGKRCCFNAVSSRIYIGLKENPSDMKMEMKLHLLFGFLDALCSTSVLPVCETSEFLALLLGRFLVVLLSSATEEIWSKATARSIWSTMPINEMWLVGSQFNYKSYAFCFSKL